MEESDMQNKSFLLLSTSLLIFLFSCVTTGPDTGVTQLTARCGNETRMLLDCKKDYEQFARTFRMDVGIIEEAAVGFGAGAQQLMRLDSLTADLLAHKRQVCIDYNNCILSREEYKNEMAFIRRAQLKVRQAASQFTSGSPPGVESAVSTSGEPPKAPPAFDALFSEVVGALVRPDAYKYSVDSDVSTDSGISADDNNLEDSTDTGDSTEAIEALEQQGQDSQLSIEEKNVFD
jgi:hypothetical protein